MTEPWDYNDVVVYGEGPVPCDIMLIGERPGLREAQAGRPFVGPAGKDFNRYLANAKLDRSAIYITNLVKCFRDYEKPSLEEITEWFPVLEQEITECDSKVIGLMGTFAVEALMQGWWKSAILNVRHGTVWILPQSRCIVVPLYHPAYGIYDKQRQADLQHDFNQLAKAYRGEVKPKELSYDAGDKAEMSKWAASTWGYDTDHKESDTLKEAAAIGTDDDPVF